jgi:hypothetical protein
MNRHRRQHAGAAIVLTFAVLPFLLLAILIIVKGLSS